MTVNEEKAAQPDGAPVLQRGTDPFIGMVVVLVSVF
jgi:hypothetical protein